MEGPINENAFTENVGTNEIKNQFDASVPSKISTWTKIKKTSYSKT